MTLHIEHRSLSGSSSQQFAVGAAGTFEQLVLTDSLSALVASPPLLYVTNAKKFCDWRLVLTAVTFQVITATQATTSTCQPSSNTDLASCNCSVGVCQNLRTLSLSLNLCKTRCCPTYSCTLCHALHHMVRECVTHHTCLLFCFFPKAPS